MTTQPVRVVWTGWTGTLLADDTRYRLTCEEWRVQKHQNPTRCPVRSAVLSPGRGEVAARALLAWFDDAACDRHTPPFDDRELGVRRFMRNSKKSPPYLSNSAAQN
jgi:hypothetical protein